MRTSQRLVDIAAIVALALPPYMTSVQDSRTNLTDTLVGLLVWGTDTKIDINAYPPDVRQELEKYFHRRKDYKSQRRRPTNSSELSMVYDAQVRYERRLVATTDDPRAPSLPAQYVDGLRPCYEWEGYHDCPEREAVFAAQYQKAHVGGPFGEFLTLLAAHRWRCAAERTNTKRIPTALRAAGANTSRRSRLPGNRRLPSSAPQQTNWRRATAASRTAEAGGDSRLQRDR